MLKGQFTKDISLSKYTDSIFKIFRFCVNLGDGIYI